MYTLMSSPFRPNAEVGVFLNVFIQSQAKSNKPLMMRKRSYRVDHAKNIILQSAANPTANPKSCLPGGRTSAAPVDGVTVGDAAEDTVLLPLGDCTVLPVVTVEFAAEEDTVGPVATAVVDTDPEAKVVFETIGPPGIAVVMAEVVAFETDTIGPPGNAVVITEVTAAAVVEVAATILVLVGVTIGVVELMVLIPDVVAGSPDTVFDPEAPTQAFIWIYAGEH